MDNRTYSILIFILLVVACSTFPWPFTVNQDSAYGKIYSIDVNSSSPPKDSMVNMTFFIQPLKDDFTFSPKFDAKSNISALDYLGTWGPTYPLSKPCKVGTACTVWCVYKSGTFVGNYTAVINITNSFHSSASEAMSVFIRLPANAKLIQES